MMVQNVVNGFNKIRMKMKTRFLIFALLALSTAACSKDDIPQVTENMERSVADFTLPTGCGVNYAKMQHDSVYVINSEGEWAKLFTGGNSPEIDFSTKTLIAVWGGVTNGITDISKELLLENNTYTLAIDITLDMTAVAPRWCVVLITDKINTQSVILKLNSHFGTEEDGQNGEPKEVPFKTYSLTETSCQWTKLYHDNEVIVINSNEALDQHITCTGNDYPAIDFSKSTLLLARGTANSSVVSVGCSRLQQISEQGYTVDVDLVLGMATVMSPWQVPILVDKLDAECAVELTVTIKY
jgi:hypothetical protein